MFLTLFFLSLRLKELLGEINRMKYLTGDEITSFFNNHELSIIFYSNPDNESRESLSFANTAISIYKELFSFALADPKFAPIEFCQSNFQESNQSSFCIVPYRKSTPIQFDPAPLTAPAFLNWLDALSHPRLTSISNINNLTQLFNGNKTCLFAVDVQEEDFEGKYGIPDNEKIYLVSRDLFSIYNLSMKQGIYFYRPNDRQIIELNQTVTYPSLTTEDNFLIRPYSSISMNSTIQTHLICGYSLRLSDSTVCEKQYGIISKLTHNVNSSQYQIDDLNKHFKFAMVTPEDLHSFTDMTAMKSVEIPYFFVVNVTKPSRLRWVIDNTNRNLLNFDYIRHFLDRIVSGNEDPYIVSEPDSSNDDEIIEEIEEKTIRVDATNVDSHNGKVSIETDTITVKEKVEKRIETEETFVDETINKYDQLAMNKIVGKTFRELAFNDTIDTVVLFTSPNSTKYKFFKPIVNAVATLLNKSSRLEFYFMDVSKNDLPPSVPEMKSFPTLILWPAGQKDKPIVYDGNSTFIDVLNFITSKSKNKIKIPHYNLDNIKEKLASILNTIRFGRNRV